MLHQLLQLVRADPADRVDGTAEHVVPAPEGARALDRHDVLGLLDHADRGPVTPLVPILLGVFAVAIVAGLVAPQPALPRPSRREPDPTPTLSDELDADPIGTISKYGTAADLDAQGFGDEIRGLGYRD